MDAYSSCCTRIRRRIPWTLIRVAGLLVADEYHGRLLELLDSYSPTDTTGRSFELLYRSRRRIPWTLIGVAGLLFADEYHGRLFELLYRSRRRIPRTLIRNAVS